MQIRDYLIFVEKEQKDSPRRSISNSLGATVDTVGEIQLHQESFRGYNYKLKG